MLPIYLINLDADVARLAGMRHQLGALGLQWERIPAVDGTTLTPGMVLYENRRACQRKLSPGEIGCLQSHVIAWRRLVESQEPAALLLEDDVLLAPAVALLVSDPSWLVSDDCLVRLETFCMPVVLGFRVKDVWGRGLYPLRSIHYGSAAYIITRKRAEALLAAYDSAIAPVDCLQFRHPHNGHVFQLSPAPCIQRDILKHGRHFDNEHSRLESERRMLFRQKWHQPLFFTRHLIGKIRAGVLIGLGMVRGYSYRIVPYGE